MKNKLVLMLSLLCTVCILPIASCQTTSGDDRVDAVKLTLTNRLANESQGAFTLASITKTNGTEENFGGAQMYELEFTCTLNTERTCWKINHGFYGYFQDFVVYPTKPTNQQEQMALGVGQQFMQGNPVNLKGKATLTKKDNGWSVDEIKLH